MDDIYIKNTFEIICRKLDLKQEITENYRNGIMADIARYSENLNSFDIMNIISKLQEQELIYVFDKLAGNKFENLCIFIIRELSKSLIKIQAREKRETEEQQIRIERERIAREEREKGEIEIQKAREIRRLEIQKITKERELEIQRIKKEKEIEEQKRKEEISRKKREDEERRIREEQLRRQRKEREIEEQRKREEISRKKKEEELRRQRETEIQRIREEQLRRIREQQLVVAQLNIEIQTDENDQDINLNNFETIVRRNSYSTIAAIYQTCISGAIMFLVDKDPLEELFTEIDKIIINEQNTNKRKNEISNKIKELKDEINNFLIQIEKDDRKKLKIYLSNPIVKDIFDRKSNNLYSNLILNPIINMIAKIEKETNNKCCIY